MPDWVREILKRYDNDPRHLFEVEIADTLRTASQNYKELSPKEYASFFAEWSAFAFLFRRRGDSPWDTHFAPLMSLAGEDGVEVHSPDLKNLDASSVLQWEGDAKTSTNPVMRARYADLVWDLKLPITQQRPDVEFARIAIDSYIDACEQKLYPEHGEPTAIHWLERALDLSRSINDPESIDHVVRVMFNLYGRIAQPRFVGTWLFLFDNLYGQTFVTEGQTTQIIENLEFMLAKTGDTRPNKDGVYADFDPWGAEAARLRLAKHYRRMHDDENVKRVTVTYGRAFEHMAREANSIMAPTLLQPVIEVYEQEGLKQAAEELQLLEEDKGKGIASELKTISVKSQLGQEDVDALVEQLIGSGEMKTSLGLIAQYFIPRVDDARELLESSRLRAPLGSRIPITIVGADGLPSGHIGSIDDDYEGRLHYQLAQTIGFYEPFLGYAMHKFRERFAPGVDDILDFLSQSPLFSESRDGLLKTGLLVYQEEDFTAAIHILVPQVEHTLRRFLGHLRVPIRRTDRDHPGITEAKSMNQILREPRMREVLTEDLWRYLTVVYVDRRGLNLRNDFAHGLLPAGAFQRHVADRVFHTLLALSLLREQHQKAISEEDAKRREPVI